MPHLKYCRRSRTAHPRQKSGRWAFCFPIFSLGPLRFPLNATQFPGAFYLLCTPRPTCPNLRNNSCCAAWTQTLSVVPTSMKSGHIRGWRVPWTCLWRNAYSSDSRRLLSPRLFHFHSDGHPRFHLIVHFLERQHRLHSHSLVDHAFQLLICICTSYAKQALL